MAFGFAYKDKQQPSLIGNNKAFALLDDNFESSDSKFFQCLFNLQSFLDIQNLNQNGNDHTQELNYLTLCIKKNPQIAENLNESNFFQIIENTCLMEVTSNAYYKYLSQIIDICSTLVSINYSNFPIRIASILLSFIKIDQIHEIIRSSLYFSFFLQNYQNSSDDQYYLHELKTLLSHETLTTNILEIEKMIWLHILHYSNYQNLSTEQSSNLLYAIYSTIPTFLMLQTNSSNFLILLQEIYFRIYEALNFIINNIENMDEDKHNNEFDDFDYLSIMQSLLFVLLKSVSFDNEFINNSLSLPFNQLLLRLLQNKSAFIEIELTLEIIHKIISFNYEYFAQNDLFYSFECILKSRLIIDDDQTIKEIKDEHLIILIYQILSINARNELYYKSKPLYIQNNHLILDHNVTVFVMPAFFILLAINMMEITSYATKTALNEFLSSLFIYGGTFAIDTILKNIDVNNQIIQFFYDFLTYYNNLELDQDSNDWRIKQMKLAIKMFLSYFSNIKKKEIKYTFNCSIDQLYECIYDDELIDLTDNINLFVPSDARTKL